jgi:hypothetical protein
MFKKIKSKGKPYLCYYIRVGRRSYNAFDEGNSEHPVHPILYQSLRPKLIRPIQFSVRANLLSW